MTTRLALHEGLIRPGLIAELEAFRAPGLRVSSYYLDLRPPDPGNVKAVRLALKDALAQDRERIDRLEAPHAVRQALRRDWEQVQELAFNAVGDRHMLAMAYFVATDSGYGLAVRLSWPVRHRAFFEDRFVLWPLRQILDQADHYALILTDQDQARLFLYFLARMEEVADVLDQVPGHVRYPDVITSRHYTHKHVEYFQHHFEHTAEAGLRLLQREPFEHLIIGSRRETLHQFESHLHRYLRDRIVARWEIDVHTPFLSILDLARQEEQRFLEIQAREIWNAVQDQRPQGALGPEEVFAALWQRRVQALVVDPDARAAGFRCSTCGRLQQNGGKCVECGGTPAAVSDVYEESVQDAVEQSAQVRFWKNAALRDAGRVAALKRY